MKTKGISDPHTVFGLSTAASPEDIKRRYRELAKNWHPDRFFSYAEKLVATRRMQQINAAYAVLKQLKHQVRYTDTRQESRQTSNADSISRTTPISPSTAGTHVPVASTWFRRLFYWSIYVAIAFTAWLEFTRTAKDLGDYVLATAIALLSPFIVGAGVFLAFSIAGHLFILSISTLGLIWSIFRRGYHSSPTPTRVSKPIRAFLLRFTLFCVLVTGSISAFWDVGLPEWWTYLSLLTIMIQIPLLLFISGELACMIVFIFTKKDVERDTDAWLRFAEEDIL